MYLGPFRIQLTRYFEANTLALAIPTQVGTAAVRTTRRQPAYQSRATAHLQFPVSNATLVASIFRTCIKTT